MNRRQSRQVRSIERMNAAMFPRLTGRELDEAFRKASVDEIEKALAFNKVKPQ